MRWHGGAPLKKCIAQLQICDKRQIPVIWLPLFLWTDEMDLDIRTVQSWKRTAQP